MRTKLISSALALVLLMTLTLGITVFADTTQEVTSSGTQSVTANVTYTKSSSYVLTLPAIITVNSDDTIKNVPITVKSADIAPNKSLSVRISSTSLQSGTGGSFLKLNRLGDTSASTKPVYTRIYQGSVASDSAKVSENGQVFNYVWDNSLGSFKVAIPGFSLKGQFTNSQGSIYENIPAGTYTANITLKAALE